MNTTDDERIYVWNIKSLHLQVEKSKFVTKTQFICFDLKLYNSNIWEILKSSDINFAPLKTTLKRD